MTRLTRLLRLPVLLTVETAMVVTLHRLGQVPALRIDVASPGRWLATVPPEDALVAVLRLVALGVTAWLLLSTTAYLLARLSGVPALVRAAARVTLPLVRRTVERSIAAGVLASTLTSPLPAGAQPATPPPRPPDVVVRTIGGVLLPPGVTPPTPIATPTPEPTPPISTPTPTPTSQRPPTPSPRTAASPTPTPEPTPITTPPPTSDRPDREPDPRPADRIRGLNRDRTGGRTQHQPTQDQRTQHPQTQHPRTPHHHRDDPTATDRRVEPGDNLWSIAERHLTVTRGTAPDIGSVARYWQRLVEDNRGALRSGDPDLIHPGETVSLPPLEPQREEDER